MTNNTKTKANITTFKVTIPIPKMSDYLWKDNYYCYIFKEKIQDKLIHLQMDRSSLAWSRTWCRAGHGDIRGEDGHLVLSLASSSQQLDNLIQSIGGLMGAIQPLMQPDCPENNESTKGQLFSDYVAFILI